jgi:hypothetical protein
MHLSTLLCILAPLIGACSGTLAAAIPPSQDPWYTAPANFESAAPGTVLRSRTAPGNLSSLLANASAAYQYLYRTTDSQYRPTWAVTTLFVPLGAAAAVAGESATAGNSKALLSYQVPYDSASVDMSPSFALNTWAPVKSFPIIIEMEQALGLGWYVSVPDYEGPLASCKLPLAFY